MIWYFNDLAPENFATSTSNWTDRNCHARTVFVSSPCAATGRWSMHASAAYHPNLLPPTKQVGRIFFFIPIFFPDRHNITVLLRPRRSPKRGNRQKITDFLTLANDISTICAGRFCEKNIQLNGHELSCTDGYRFESVCRYRCDDGYAIPGDGTSVLRCDATQSPADPGDETMDWHATLTICQR